MTRRYVFWRTPTGRPGQGKDSGKYAPKAVLAELGEIATLTPEGKVQWSGFIFKQLEFALRSISVVLCPDGNELNDDDAWKIMHAAVVATTKKTGGKKALNESAVLRAADEEAARFFRGQEKPYLLVSSMSVDAVPFKRVEIIGCQILPLVSRVSFPYPAHARHFRAVSEHLKSSKYQFLKVLVAGRSIHEAADRAMTALTLLRGLWSLSATYGSWSISFGGVRDKPIGVIHPGPIHTLHHRDGKLVGDIFWYNREAQADRELYKPKNDEWQKIEGNRRWFSHRLKKLPFRNEVEQLLVRYARALDQSDHDVAFLQMWSILENVTDTVGNYDETVKRAVWPYQERQLMRDYLECMRSRRNLYVHASKTGEAPDQAVYLVKGFVDYHLARAVRNTCKAVHLGEYARHLARSPDLNVLRKERHALNLAIRTLTPKASPS
jgi:hypothetical protein